MKKLLAFLLLSILLLTISSCTQQPNNDMTEREREINERIIVEYFGYDQDSPGVALSISDVDLSSVEAITETTTQIVLCHVENIKNTSTNLMGDIIFNYEIIIKDILMDVNNRLEIGDIVVLTTSQGIIKGTDFTKLVRNSAQAQKTGLAYREYKDNEYIVSSYNNSIPIEIGRTYLLYLTDRYLENYDVYSTSGRRLSYEYTDGVLFHGTNYEKMDICLEQLKEQIFSDIRNRTGRADEIGFYAYTDELAEIQQRERMESNKE